MNSSLFKQTSWSVNIASEVLGVSIREGKCSPWKDVICNDIYHIVNHSEVSFMITCYFVLKVCVLWCSLELNPQCHRKWQILWLGDEGLTFMIGIYASLIDQKKPDFPCYPFCHGRIVFGLSCKHSPKHHLITKKWALLDSQSARPLTLDFLTSETMSNRFPYFQTIHFKAFYSIPKIMR